MQIRTFETSASANGSAYAQLRTALAVSNVGGSNPQMSISPDDSTIVVAGTTQLVVRPVPAK